MAIAWDELIEREWRRSGPALQEDYDHLGRQLKRRGIDIAADARPGRRRSASPSPRGAWRPAAPASAVSRGPASRANVDQRSRTAPWCRRLDRRDAPHLAAHPVGPPRRSRGAPGARGRARPPHLRRSTPILSRTSPDSRTPTSSAASPIPMRRSENRWSRTTWSAWRSGDSSAPGAVGVDWRRRQLPGPGPRTAGAGALPRQPARRLRRAAGGLAPVHRAQTVRTGVLLHRPQRLGRELPLRARTGTRALSLVDLGHHAPNVNVEMIVARLVQFGKLGGFHFNDSKYGDDDLDAGSSSRFSCS